MTVSTTSCPTDGAVARRAVRATLYDELAPYVWPLVVSILGDPARAEEVTTRVFAELADSPGPELPGTSRRAWALALAHRRAVEERRRGATAASAPNGAAPRVDTTFATLSERERGCVALAYVDGAGADEIGRRMDLPATEVPQQARAGMRRLRDAVRSAAPRPGPGPGPLQ